MAKADYEYLRGQLKINDLDGSLLTNADLCYQVYRAHMDSIAERDALQLMLEEEEAKAAIAVRKRDAIDADGKKKPMTEKAVEQALALDAKLQKIRDDVLEARAAVDRWRALEKAYDRRSDALRELVKWRIAEMNNLAMELGGRAGHRDVARANETAANALRRRNRLEGATQQ